MILNPKTLLPLPVPTVPSRPSRRFTGTLSTYSACALLCLAGAPGDAAALSAPDTTRTYYVSAEEVDWDYAPAGRDLMMGEAFGPEDSIFVTAGPDRVGSTYRKAIYREYTDSTFTTMKPVSPEWAHKGIMGPILRAEVGDTIRVVFRNLASRPYTMHPHGVLYDKASEGAPTNDGTSGALKADDSVAPGDGHTYVWAVPERAGPMPSGPSSTVWLYHSHLSEPKDTNAGLMGAIVVTRRGMADAEGRPVDVDREFVTLFKVFDENVSWYLDENLRRAGLDEEPDEEGNLMHAINGLVYGSLPVMTMRQGERVRWYLLDLGSEFDLHTAHWHGNVTDLYGRRTDVVELMPGSMKVADMVADNPGTWMFHCHVDDHITAGMTGRYRVLPADADAEDRDEPRSSGVWTERETVLMGTRFRARVQAPDRARGVSALEAVFTEVARLEGVLSTWDPESDLSRLNRWPVNVPVRPTPELAGLLDEAWTWSGRTGRAFEPVLGALVDAWGLRGQGREPSPGELAEARAATGPDGAGLLAGTGMVGRDELRSSGSGPSLGASGSPLRFVRRSPRAWIDAGGFGKGAALRAAAGVLTRHGVERASLDFGGQLLILGPAADGEGRPVAVAHPARRAEEAAVLRVRNVSVATSGLSERPGHILDPRTGRPVPARGSVTVVASDPLVADILSTALYVMGPDGGLQWARENTDAGVLFLEHDGSGGLRARWNDPMDTWLERVSDDVIARANPNPSHESPHGEEIIR